MLSAEMTIDLQALPDGPSLGTSFGRLAGKGERAIAVLALATIAALPVLEILARPFAAEGLAGSIDLVRQLTLWIGFLGAMLAAGQGRHLALGFSSTLKGPWREAAETIAGSLGIAVCLLLAVASFHTIEADRSSLAMVASVIPLWVAEIIMPVGFGVTGLRLLARMPGGRRDQITALLATLLIISLALVPPDYRGAVVMPGALLILVGAVAGAPIFALLGASSLLLCYADAAPLAAISAEAYRIASNPILPTIPLFRGDDGSP